MTLRVSQMPLSHNFDADWTLAEGAHSGRVAPCIEIFGTPGGFDLSTLPCRTLLDARA